MRMVEAVDLYECRDMEHLRRALMQHIGAIALILADHEWPLRVERDQTFREELLTGLANAGLALARITELVEAPPDVLRVHAEIMRDVRDPEGAAIRARERFRVITSEGPVPA